MKKATVRVGTYRFERHSASVGRKPCENSIGDVPKRVCGMVIDMHGIGMIIDGHEVWHDL